MENTSQQNAKNRKFKQTKQLVRLALNDGWTQKSIADKCRTQQSIVSAWARGEKQGTEAQLASLSNRDWGGIKAKPSFLTAWLFYRA
jgi:transcriptional regulator with XRE-family HTH domain